MSDFHQNGIIATLHNFNEKKIDDIEKDLLKFSQNTPMTLILPSLYSELQRPALTYIVNTLKKIKSLSPRKRQREKYLVLYGICNFS